MFGKLQNITPLSSLQTLTGRGILANLMGTSNVFGGRFLAVPEWAFDYISEHGQPRDLQVLIGLVAMMSVHTKEVESSIPEIAKRVRVSKETAKRSLKWLEEHHIITVVRRPRPASSVYKVMYTQKIMGSPMTPYRVTHDPIMGSPMTLLEEGDGVTGDPIKIDKTPACDQQTETPRVIIDIEINREMVKRAEGDMIIGADPDKNDKPTQQEIKRKPRPEVNDLTNYFVYHPRSVMNCSYTFQDMNILRRNIRLLLDGGLTRPTIKAMIDRFFTNERFIKADSPVLMFCTKSVQETLMDKIPVALDDDMGDTLKFLMSDFDRSGINLPWSTSIDITIQQAVILRGLDASYRYPELVARIIETSFDTPNLQPMISALNSLVRWHLNEEDADITELHSTLSVIDLPKELMSTTKQSIRPAADSIVSAVYNYRRSNRK